MIHLNLFYWWSEKNLAIVPGPLLKKTWILFPELVDLDPYR